MPVSRFFREALEKGLDMSKHGRLARAREMGFDTSRPVYHGTASDFDAFDPDRAIGTQFWSTTNRGAIEAGEVGAEGKGVIKEMFHRIENPAGWDEYDKFGIDELIARGYDGLALPDADGHVVYNAFSPNQYRDINAAFDPAHKESSNLLASLAPAAVGLGALAQSDDSEAAVEAPDSFIRAPQHGWLADATMGARGLQRRLEGHPASLLFPEGLVDYAETLAYGDKPTWGQRLGAMMDFF